MDAKGYSRIPRELCYWITFLAEALPLRSVGTFIELLIGAMLTPAGFVTEAYLVVTMRNHWSSYYKWLQKGRWSWLGLSRQFVRLILKVVKQEVIHLVIDDTLTLRASKKAPGSQIHHQHGNKPNLAQYVRGQCWVSLAWVIRREKQPVALPLLTRLVPGISNTGKRVAAKTLIRAVYRLLDGRKVRVLVDSWYMRRIFIESMLARGFDVIGQVRIDTRLYDEPPKRKKGQRGRPRKYGRKYTPKRIAHLKRSMVTLPLYGKEQEVRYRSKVLMAHFLGGRLVRVVWCEFKSESGHWKKAHLLLSTDAKLTPEQIIEAYGERWSIESMFNQLKLSWGLKEAWQQTRQTLHRWVHLTLVGYGLIQLLGYLDDQTVRQLCCHSPWRKDIPTTAGQIRKGLLLIFHHVPVRQWWNRKCRKQACLRPRDRFWDIPVPKIDSAFDNLFVPQPSWSPSTAQQLRKLVAAPYLAPNDWTPRSEAYFVFPLAQGTPGKQCGLAATGVYQPSLRSPWLAADVDRGLPSASRSIFCQNTWLLSVASFGRRPCCCSREY